MRLMLLLLTLFLPNSQAKCGESVLVVGLTLLESAEGWEANASLEVDPNGKIQVLDARGEGDSITADAQ